MDESALCQRHGKVLHSMLSEGSWYSIHFFLALVSYLLPLFFYLSPPIVLLLFPLSTFITALSPYTLHPLTPPFFLPSHPSLPSSPSFHLLVRLPKRVAGLWWALASQQLQKMCTPRHRSSTVLSTTWSHPHYSS